MRKLFIPFVSVVTVATACLALAAALVEIVSESPSIPTAIAAKGAPHVVLGPQVLTQEFL